MGTPVLFMSFETYRRSFLESGNGWDDGTMFLYMGIILLVMRFGQLAEKRCKHTHSFWFVAAAIVLSAILGFRGENVGADTWQYMHSFNNALERNYWSDSNSEPGFHLLLKILRFILPNSTVFLMLISTLTIYFVFNTLWRYRSSINLLIAFSFYVGLYYFQALNLLRIYLAAAFLLWNYHYLVDKKYGKFALIVLLTSMIHYSSLVMLLPLGFLWFYQKRPKLALISVVALVMVGIPLTTQFGDLIRIARYAAYGDSNESSRSVGVMLFFDYLPPFFFVYYALKNRIKGQWTDMLVSLTVCGFVVRLMAYYITIAGRLSIHFMGLFVLVLPYFISYMKQRHRKLFIPVIFAILIYLAIRVHLYFVGYLAPDAIMPYYFFWNDL